MKSDLIELDLFIERETEKAILVENLKDEYVWLPKSQIEVEDNIVTMPEWLAIEKELL